MSLFDSFDSKTFSINEIQKNIVPQEKKFVKDKDEVVERNERLVEGLVKENIESQQQFILDLDDKTLKNHKFQKEPGFKLTEHGINTRTRNLLEKIGSQREFILNLHDSSDEINFDMVLKAIDKFKAKYPNGEFSSEELTPFLQMMEEMHARLSPSQQEFIKKDLQELVIAYLVKISQEYSTPESLLKDLPSFLETMELFGRFGNPEFQFKEISWETNIYKSPLLEGRESEIRPVLQLIEAHGLTLSIAKKINEIAKKGLGEFDAETIEIDNKKFIVYFRNKRVRVRLVNEVIGEGTFGKVYRVLDLLSGKMKVWKESVDELRRNKTRIIDSDKVNSEISQLKANKELLNNKDLEIEGCKEIINKNINIRIKKEKNIIKRKRIKKLKTNVNNIINLLDSLDKKEKEKANFWNESHVDNLELRYKFQKDFSDYDGWINEEKEKRNQIRKEIRDLKKQTKDALNELKETKILKSLSSEKKPKTFVKELKEILVSIENLQSCFNEKCELQEKITNLDDSIPFSMSESQVQLKNERNLLFKLNEVARQRGVSMVGIQSKPSEVKNINSTEVGYFSKIYNQGSYSKYLDKFPDLPPQDHLYACHQLLQGLVFLHENNMTHGDIKEENILVNIDDEGKKEFVLSDFGGVTDMSDENFINPNNISSSLLWYAKKSRTNAYVSNNDLSMLEMLAQVRDKDKFFELDKKIDVFSFGIMLYRVFSGKKDPIESENARFGLTPSEEGQWIRENGKDDLKNVKEPIKDLIFSMLSYDPAQRPTAKEVLEILEKALQEYDFH